MVYKWEMNEDNFKDGLPYFDAMNYYIVNDSSGIIDACKAEQAPKTDYLNINANGAARGARRRVRPQRV